ncbi:hypothetical protein [Pseudomonas aeruginosa]|uniref:hypothetical protein n=1 Tax=Pseudomonas aeruginosa TaxID=287 RepID=UPI001F235BAB|nr:hypothetical protein [Pseudomonas aeruginosa]
MGINTPGVVVPDGYELQVAECGTRLWVNAPDGSCVGRFSKRFGSDLHNTVTAMMAGASECIHCTHGEASVEDWDAFRAKLQAAYQVTLPAGLIRF